MDTRFIGKPHEWDPRRVYSQTGADWQYRVDFDRLRKDRLARVREQMTKRDIGALVLVCRRQRTLCHWLLSRKLEIQHQHPLRRGAQWR